MGSVMVTPMTSAATKKSVTYRASPCTPEAIIAPSTTAAPRMTTLTTCWPLKRKLFLMSPCSLPKAMIEPENDTAPIRPPSTASAPRVGPRFSPA